MSVTVYYVSQVSMVVRQDSPFLSPSNPDYRLDGMDTAATLNAGTTPPVLNGSQYRKPLVGGAATIDLTSFPGNSNNEIINGTGMRVNVAKFKNPSTNTGAITVKFGAASPYLLGGAGWSQTLQPGEEWTFKGLAKAPVIGSGAKNIDLAGTGTEALDVTIGVG